MSMTMAQSRASQSSKRLGDFPPSYCGGRTGGEASRWLGRHPGKGPPIVRHSYRLNITALPSSALPSTVLDSSALHSKVIHSSYLHSRVLHFLVLHSRVLHSSVLHSRVIHSSSLHSRVIHSAALPAL